MRGAQESVHQQVLYEWTEYCGAIEYRLRLLIPKTGFFSRTHKLLIAQVVRYTDNLGVKMGDYDFMLVVFKPKDEELARNIAATLPLVYGDKIKIKIGRVPIYFPWFIQARSDGLGDDDQTYVDDDRKLHTR